MIDEPTRRWDAQTMSGDSARPIRKVSVPRCSGVSSHPHILQFLCFILTWPGTDRLTDWQRGPSTWEWFWGKISSLFFFPSVEWMNEWMKRMRNERTFLFGQREKKILGSKSRYRLSLKGRKHSKACPSPGFPSLGSSWLCYLKPAEMHFLSYAESP